MISIFTPDEGTNTKKDRVSPRYLFCVTVDD
jgi:hypothetical protein